MTVSLIVPGVPVPLYRSRTRNGQHYLPKRSREYRELVQAEWMVAGRPTLGDKPFSASMRFYGSNARADLDNMVKAVLDGLNGLAYDDDSQLACLSRVHKLALDERGPRCEIELRVMAEVAA
jgi:crossover junction endodeoxyribonuclease RusA